MSVGWVALGTAAVGVVGGVIAADAAKDAADTQAGATRDAAAATKSGQDAALAAQQPFLNAGYSSVNRLQELLGLSKDTGAAGFGSMNKPFEFNQGDLTQDPKYQFQLQQGQNALDRKASAGGGFYSGAGLQAASAFNQDLAGTTFDDAYNRQFNAFQTDRANTLNPLQSLAGQGQSSANSAGQIQMGGANSLASLMTNQGNASAAAGIAQSNALTGGINSGLTAWQRAQMMQQPQQQQQPVYGLGSSGWGMDLGGG